MNKRQKRDAGMAALLFDETTSDVKLTFDDGSSLFAHRAILASRSPVLKNLLFGSMRESGQPTVKLAGIESAAMHCLCRSIYCGGFGDALDLEEGKADLALHVAKAADQYQLDVTEDLEELIDDNMEVPEYLAVLKALPDVELGPMLMVVKLSSIAKVADNLEDCSNEALARIPSRLLVEILRHPEKVEWGGSAAASGAGGES